MAPSARPWAGFLQVSFGVLVSVARSRTAAHPGSLPEGQTSLTG